VKGRILAGGAQKSPEPCTGRLSNRPSNLNIECESSHVHSNQHESPHPLKNAWICTVLFYDDIISASKIRISLLVMPIEYGYLTTFLLPISYRCVYIYTMKEPSYLGRVILVSMWFRTDLT
jgi:hypothetical protein